MKEGQCYISTEGGAVICYTVIDGKNYSIYVLMDKYWCGTFGYNYAMFLDPSYYSAFIEIEGMILKKDKKMTLDKIIIGEFYLYMGQIILLCISENKEGIKFKCVLESPLGIWKVSTEGILDKYTIQYLSPLNSKNFDNDNNESNRCI